MESKYEKMKDVSAIITSFGRHGTVTSLSFNFHLHFMFCCARAGKGQPSGKRGALAWRGGECFYVAVRVRRGQDWASVAGPRVPRTLRCRLWEQA